MITEKCIDTIKQHIIIQEVIGKYVKLKKQGGNMSGLCPFHVENTPSFSVNIPRQFYKCFGCGESGDGIQFIMKHEKKSFVEALEWMAKFYNIELSYHQESAEDKIKRFAIKVTQDGMRKVMSIANTIYQKNLSSLDDSSVVWKYLNSRGIGREIVSDWEIGLAPLDRKCITTRLISDNMYQSAVETGIIQTDEEGVTNDFFCNRLIYPIHDLNGNVISMGGRIIPLEGVDNKKYPKWKNLPESPLYKKSGVLYGLYQALTAKALNEDKNGDSSMFLVEGYNDVISMHKAGVFNTVASCGTSVTPDQLRIIKKYTPNISLYLDGTKTVLKNGKKEKNESGKDAMLKLISPCLKAGLRVMVVDTPEKDPDEYAREYETKHNLPIKNNAAA